MKKTLSIILAILMIVTSVPFAFAAENYKITHQPLVGELFVMTNDDNATYQWYEVTDNYVIDNITATAFDPSVFGSDHDFTGESSYNERTGWTPAYHKFPNGLFELYFFTVALKKGETVTFEFSSANMNPALLYELEDTKNIVLNGNIGTFTAEEDGNYTLTATGFQGGTVKASSDGKFYSLLEGETSDHLKNVEEDKIYVCYVTYSDGTAEMSAEVSGHKHVMAETTCMGYKCSICGGLFGDAYADVHSFTYYTQTVAPTCTKEGSEKAECDYGCSVTDVRTVPATNHKGTLVEVEAKDATCTEAGYEAYKYCTACDYTTYKEISAGHTPLEAVTENEVAPKCGVAGSYDIVVYCDVCGEEIVRTSIPVAALSHKDDDGDYKCDNGCGYEYEKPEPSCIDELVAYVEAIENELIATYGEAEYKTIVAALSDETNAELLAITDEAIALTGSVKDNEEKFNELKARIAVILTGIENCLKGDHNDLSYAVTEEAKCEVNAIESATCTLCGEVITRDVENSALTHKDADGDYKCDNGCGYEYEKPADPTPDEPIEPDTPDEPAEDVCKDCGKVHDSFFAELICFFTKIINFFKNIFG